MEEPEYVYLDRYAYRPPQRVPVNVSLDRDAAMLLRQLRPAKGTACFCHA